MHGSVSISSKKRPAAMRSGTWATKTSSPTSRSEVLGDVARDEVGGARRDGRAQHDRLARPQVREQVVERRADVADVDLDVRERRRPERDDDVLRASRVRDRVGQLQPPGRVDAVQDLLGARLLERHAAVRHGGEALGIGVDAEYAQPAIGEGQGEREPDPPDADDGDVDGHDVGG